jgi:hypothetical protein
MPTRMTERPGIETMFRDANETARYLSGFPAAACVGFLIAEKWIWVGAFAVVTGLTLVGVPIVYRNWGHFRERRSLRRRLYIASLPINLILVVVLSNHFSAWATLLAGGLFVSAFLAGLQSSSEPSLLKRQGDDAQ